MRVVLFVGPISMVARFHPDAHAEHLSLVTAMIAPLHSGHHLWVPPEIRSLTFRMDVMQAMVTLARFPSGFSAFVYAGWRGVSEFGQVVTGE